MENQERAGRFVRQPEGYVAFVPAPLPPHPELKMDAAMLMALSSADRALGRLDGITRTLPNPDLFVDMYVKKESLLSSQIEGTQASFAEIITGGTGGLTEDQREVSNYVAALNYGLQRVHELPLSLRLLREIHARLLAVGRGADRNPGEFRRSQNWIGSAHCSLQTAAFVPPSVPDMEKALGDLESFFYAEEVIPPLIKIALIHAQFESIHPFLDGNGRVGRLLITFWLVHQQILSKPLLYLSLYFKRYRTEYYDLLMAVRKEGKWEEWVMFFLKGVTRVSQDACVSAQKILRLRQETQERLVGINHHNMIDFLFSNPIFTRATAAKALQVSSSTGGGLIRRLLELGVLEPCADEGRVRNVRFRFSAYLSILEAESLEE